LDDFFRWQICFFLGWSALMPRKKSKIQGIHLIAQLADVSIGTVDRALHGRRGINESTRQKVLRVAQKIGYTPNLAARALSSAKAKIRIGVCIPREIRFFYDQLWGGILDEARRVAPFGVELVNHPVHALGENDAEAFQDLVNSGVDGIILTAGNPQALTPLIDAAEAKGIRVVCVSTDAPGSRRSSIVCVEPSLNGFLAGELMGKFLPPGSRVAVVAGMLTAEDHRKKTSGFSRGFPQHNVGGKVVAVIEGHEHEKESYEKTADLLLRIPDLSGLYVNTVNCLPVCRALESRGLAGKVSLIATDLFPEMSSLLQQGTIAASIYQHPFRQGQIALRNLSDNLLNGVALQQHVHLSPGLVMASNVLLFRELRYTEAPDLPVPRKRVVA
jgi:LacI family transcriptional regulator